MFGEAKRAKNADDAARERDAVAEAWFEDLIGKINGTAWREQPGTVVEAAVVVILGLLFGFRPCTLYKLQRTEMTTNAEGLIFTEPFRKGYAAKSNKLRRLRYPWRTWP